MSKVAVLGAGSWGTALAIQLARSDLDVFLWGHLESEIAQIQQSRENAHYLPGINLPDNLQAYSDLQVCVKDAEEVLIVVPSHAFSSVVRQLKPLVSENTRISWASKGLSPENNALLSDVCRNILGPQQSLAVVSGPTFAMEVARGLPTAIVIASEQEKHAEKLASYLQNGAFRPYTSNDVIGVQVGGAAKNVMAIAAGISDGLGYGANSRAALISRGLAEISRFGLALGGQAETFMGLAGLGDLVLTCTDDQSRNRRLGLALAGGKSIEQAREEIGQEVEGIGTTREVFLKAKEIGVEMPITDQAYKVLYENMPPEKAVQSLLSRQVKAENN